MPRFPPQGLPRRVPLLQRYYQGITTSCRPSCRASLPSLGSTSVALIVFAPWQRVRRQGPELFARCLRPGSRRGNDRSSQVPGEPQNCPFAHVQSTPAGLPAPDHYGAAAWPLVFQKQRLPRKVFRSSIAWLSDSLSTLRSRSYLRPTQDSLPAAGQALPDGLSTRKVPMKGFRVASYISSPFPKLCLAQ